MNQEVFFVDSFFDVFVWHKTFEEIFFGSLKDQKPYLGPSIRKVLFDCFNSLFCHF